MEKRLKKQRRRLCLRIVLIMLAVWAAVSALFSVVRINLERSELQKSETEKFSYSKQLLTDENGSESPVNLFFMNNPELLYSENKSREEYDRQYIFREHGTLYGDVDTARSVGVNFSVKATEDRSQLLTGLLCYDDIRNALSDDQFSEIEKFLNTKREDGDHYELVCSKLQLYVVKFVPIELKVVLVNGSDPRFLTDESVAVYDLSSNSLKGLETYDCGYIKQNIVPKEFILDGVFSDDLIGTLTKEQRKQAVGMVHTRRLEYIFYISDQFVVYDAVSGNAYIDVRCAKRIDLLKSCGSDLVIGNSVIAVFFLTVTALMCIMIWTTIREQMIGEQKRQYMTSALTHDIKTPLFVISGYAYSLKENIDEAERDKYVDRIIEQTEEIDRIIHRMLELSKLDSYETEVICSEFDLFKLAQETVNALPSLPDGKTISLQGSCTTVSADREMIKSVLRNLTDNAVKYSLPNSEIVISAENGTFKTANKCTLMTKNEIAQLWQPFVRHDKSRSKRGSGLGLSIVRSAAQLHGAECGMEMKGDVLECTFKLKEV